MSKGRIETTEHRLLPLMKTCAAAVLPIGKEGEMFRHDRQAGSPRPISAQFFLWTIRKQDYITRRVTMNMWSAVSVVLAIALAGFVTLETALQIIFAGGLMTGALIWILIERRRSWLLSLSDPELKAEAHQAMIDYLVKKTRSGSEQRRRMNRSDVRPTTKCFYLKQSRGRDSKKGVRHSAGRDSHRGRIENPGL